MRITFILPFAGLSGGIRVPAIYAEKLIQRGHQVQVVSVPPATVPLSGKIKSVLRGWGWPKTQDRASHFDGLSVPHKVLEQYRPIVDADVPDADVVIGTWWETLEWVSAFSPSKGAKVSFIQGYDPVFYEEYWPDKRVRSTRTWELPAHKILISKWLMELAKERFGDSHASHVPNSVDVKQFYAAPRKKQAVPTVGMQYAIPRCKGLDVALRALELAAREVPEMRVVAFGWQEPSKNHPMPPGSKFIAQPRQDSIRDIYASCDVWLCGSRCEGFHLPPLEAMACRCPVVSTKVGGPMDVIEEGVNGHLVEVEDSAALADRLVRMFRLPEERWQAMSEAAYATAGRYSWDEAADLFEAALHLAVERNRRGELRPAALAGNAK
jgi:glycosyltransferase involved in cell wall biosynthesis